jgi:hypothetical protein
LGTAIIGHPLEPKIAAGSHHILIVSDRPASPTLLEGLQYRRQSRKPDSNRTNQLQNSSLQMASTRVTLRDDLFRHTELTR